MYFNAKHLPPPSQEYVAWFDVMGTQAFMTRSINATANFVFKLHIAALESMQPRLSLYPVMDGVYVTSIGQADILGFLRNVFNLVAEEFIGTADIQHRFVIRGGLAFGPIYHGANVANSASPVLAAHVDYRAKILLGIPMVQAHVSESLAPPFGLFVHESARAFASPGTQPMHSAWWHWKAPGTAGVWAALEPAMHSYLDWYKLRTHSSDYSAQRIDHHRASFAELCQLAV